MTASDSTAPPTGAANETITGFEYDGIDYELDDLRLGTPSLAGMYAIYLEDRQVAEFALPIGTAHEPPPLPELVEMARATLADAIESGAHSV